MAVFNLAGFHNKLRITDYTLDLTENATQSRSVGGLLNTASSGPRLWNGRVTVGAYSHEGNRELHALTRSVQTVGNYFLFSPIKRQKPQKWLASQNWSSVQANGTQAGGYSLKLKGLPPNVELRPGDYFHFVIGGTNRLFEIAESVTASATGTATVTTTHPMTMSGIPAANAAITFINPSVTCVLVPDSVSTGQIKNKYTEGVSFSFIQYVRPL